MASFVIFGWLSSMLLLFLYSFSQIDLGLTLTQLTFWQSIQTSFQYLGYFQRPLSTQIYLVILTGLFAFYFLILRAVRQRQFSAKKVWLLVLATAGILWLSYNAFSYDLFNYIFDAKIVTFYHQNPYIHKALDYPADPMLGFMHWTHRLYPYGPLWLALTVPLSFLGFQKFLLTAILFKGLAVVGYLAASWFIFRILERTTPKLALLGLAIFAFNPLVVIEGLVSAHNDIVMVALVLGAFWFGLSERRAATWILWLASVGIKFATGILLPLFLVKKFWPRAALFLMTMALVAVIRRTSFQPWYFLYILPFVALLPETQWLFWLTTSLSAGFLLHYAPFLYLGNWNPPVPEIKLWLTAGFLLLGFLLAVGANFFKSRQGVVKSKGEDGSNHSL